MAWPKPAAVAHAGGMQHAVRNVSVLSHKLSSLLIDTASECSWFVPSRRFFMRSHKIRGPSHNFTHTVS